MNVLLDDGNTVEAHCPVSGRIGGLTLDGIPVMVSGPYTGRRTSYTVEGVGLHPLDSPQFQWIGVNQNKINHYMKEFVQNGTFATLLPIDSTVESEVKLNNRRIDLRVGGEWIEIKMPLLKVHATNKGLPLKEFPTLSLSDRLPNQLKEMTDSGAPAHLVVCFQYSNDTGSTLQEQLDDNIYPHDIEQALADGLQLHVAQFKISTTHIEFVSVTTV